VQKRKNNYKAVVKIYVAIFLEGSFISDFEEDRAKFGYRD